MNNEFRLFGDILIHQSYDTIHRSKGSNPENLNNLLKNDYNAIVDFMIYGTKEFSDKCDLFLNNTDQYIYLSSYRVYSDAKGPITETTPRLLDVSTDSHYLASDDYSLHKARGEDRLHRKNKLDYRTSNNYLFKSKNTVNLFRGQYHN